MLYAIPRASGNHLSKGEPHHPIILAELRDRNRCIKKAVFVSIRSRMCNLPVGDAPDIKGKW